MNDEVFLPKNKTMKETDDGTRTNISLLTDSPPTNLGSNVGSPSSPTELQKTPLALALVPPVKDANPVVDENKLREEDDINLKQSENGTLLSRGGEFGAEEVSSSNTNDSALNDLQTTSDIRFFICGSCKNNPILIGSTPKLLPCLHSFCDSCLQEKYEKQRKVTDSNSPPRLKCPLCGQEFLVATNDRPTSGFLNNQFVIESTVSGPRKNESDVHQCTSCDDKSTATSYCMNCNEWLCDACVNAHQRVKVTKDHIIQTKSSRDSPKPQIPDTAKEKPLFCKVHPLEQLRLFCANCDKLTCRDCQLVEHKDHRYQFIDEAASKHREILKKLLQYLQINLGLLKETIVDVEKVSDGLSFQEKGLEEDINKAFQSLIDSIKDRQDQLKKELKGLVLTKQALLAKQKKDLTQMKVILEHNHDFAEFAVKGGSNVALLYSRKVLGTRLHNLNSLKYRQRPLALTDLKFSMDVDKLCTYFSKIGAAYSHEDMQRKIDHYNAKTPPTSAPRTMSLTSCTRPYLKPQQQTPIESITAINRRISETTSVTSSAAYINLSRQGSFGLPGHQTIRTSPPRQASGQSQEMIVLSTSNPRLVRNNETMLKKDMTSKYLQLSYDRAPSSHNEKTAPPDKMTHSPYQHPIYHHPSPSNHSVRDYSRDHSTTTNSSPREQALAWSMNLNHSSLKNNTIDQLRRMVEGGSPSPVSHTLSTEMQTTVSEPSSSQPNRLPSTSTIKVEKCSDGSAYSADVQAMQQDDIRCEIGFDEGQNNEDYCGVCRNGGQLLCCDTCPKVYHLHCHVPALSDLPSDSWSCGLCHQIGAEPSRPGHKRRLPSQQLSEWEMKLCRKTLLNLFVHTDSLPFHHKVNKLQVTDYYKVITKPMDLMTVLHKLSSNNFDHYKSLEDFVIDIRLIFANCFIYNSADSDVCKMGRRLEAHFDNLLKLYAPDINAYPDNEPRSKRWKDDVSHS